MRGILDLLVAIVAARMGGDDGTGIKDAHGIWGGTDLERAAHVGVRDRVVVPVEARVRCFMHPHDDALLAREGIIRQREQPRSLLLEALAYAAGPILRTWPRRRLPAAPGERLGIEIGHIGVAPGRKEAVANEADRALDAPLLVAAGDRHRPRLEPVPRGELEQRRVKTDGITGALQHGAAQVIVETDPWHGHKVGEGLHVRVQEAAGARRSSKIVRTDGASRRAPSRRPSAAAARDRW